MEAKLRERIKSVLAQQKTNVNQIARGDRTVQNRLNRQINRDVAITADTIEILLEEFPDLSAEWLMRGKGDMYVKQQEQTPMGMINNSQVVTIDTAALLALKAQVEKKDEQIDKLLSVLSRAQYV